MDNTFVHEDLNAVIRQHSEWLANQLHSQRESLFPTRCREDHAQIHLW